ncbi:DUF4870 domain-containing protein [Lysinibacillus piscis]|uniref:DUF4870 domain-containing protein n=1 Tax=Lysinibacillus piscis TaxID=2518931 RepID=A0ABQ5NQF0_9BACI|nr:DUF4870 domain-containing protein [Lysinibacillus sp. KH24]GLC90333.1 hypothetical protein LYSBPC_34600 [Lysinibacillus sp. KH24]
MENQKLLAALSYLSVFFAPFLVPLVVYFVSKDHEVKKHSMRALLSHLIPIVFGLIFFAVFMFFSISMNTESFSNSSILILFGSMALYGLVALGVLIWNIIQAVRVVR